MDSSVRSITASSSDSGGSGAASTGAFASSATAATGTGWPPMVEGAEVGMNPGCCQLPFAFPPSPGPLEPRTQGARQLTVVSGLVVLKAEGLGAGGWLVGLGRGRVGGRGDGAGDGHGDGGGRRVLGGAAGLPLGGAAERRRVVPAGREIGRGPRSNGGHRWR